MLASPHRLQLKDADNTSTFISARRILSLFLLNMPRRHDELGAEALGHGDMLLSNPRRKLAAGLPC
jgi:hypothetical protein